MSAVFATSLNAFPSELSGDSQVAKLRVPPHSIEAESSVLGGLLLDNSAWDRVGDLLVDNDFYRHEHKLIYAAIGALINASKPAGDGHETPWHQDGHYWPIRPLATCTVWVAATATNGTVLT